MPLSVYDSVPCTLYPGEAFWDQPFDAVEVNRKETYCTDYWEPGKRFVQAWYTCEQCNNAWEHFPHETDESKGPARLKKICAVCIVRCHRYHKGVRMVHSSSVQCECHRVSDLLFCTPCVGMAKNARQTELQRLAALAAVEKNRFAVQNKQCPPVFALVPPVWPDGKPKKWSGWRLCRRPPLDGRKLSQVGLVVYDTKEESASETSESEGSDMNSVGSDVSGDSQDVSVISQGTKETKETKETKGTKEPKGAGAGTGTGPWTGAGTGTGPGTGVDGEGGKGAKKRRKKKGKKGSEGVDEVDKAYAALPGEEGALVVREGGEGGGGVGGEGGEGGVVAIAGDNKSQGEKLADKSQARSGSLSGDVSSDEEASVAAVETKKKTVMTSTTRMLPRKACRTGGSR